ncbi:hypothetical protein Dalk_4247 [Desulfatibacillum aliphaticivorans]|uniref:DUF2059 domain-containing protein n=1 Tax=Desulfatibacillum aliphaticivorans TaxID=218208 RepID=B8FM91_DESAL|nr:DUF2059 domain-containing protein [Desulfatibacillum aliphaticivorans]ACL05929.1 hypothetical protein Dalk_4247 [Desulfatibacillum aliphaticivorans]
MKRIVIAAMALLLSACSYPGLEKQYMNSPVRELVLRSTAKDMAEGLQADWEGAVKPPEDGEASVDAIKNRQYRQFLVEAFDPERFEDLIYGFLDESLTEKVRVKIKKWDNSPLGRKVAQIERAKKDAAPDYSGEAVQEALEAHGNAAKRTTLIRELVDAVGRPAFLAQATEDMVTAMAAAIQVEHDAVWEDVEDMRDDLISDMGLDIKDLRLEQFNETAVDLKELTNREIMELTKHYKSPEMQLYMQNLYKALNTGMKELGAKAGEAIVTLMSQEVASVRIAPPSLQAVRSNHCNPTSWV